MEGGDTESCSDLRPSQFPGGFAIGAIAGAYFFAHQLSFLFPDSAKVLMAIWPAGGIGLASLLLCPRRKWRAILVALFVSGYLADLIAGRPAVPSFGFMVANILESFSCAWCLTRWCGDNIRFNRIKQISSLVFLATVVNALTACLGSAAALHAHAASFVSFWFAWWISDGLGILLVAPCIVMMVRTEEPIAGIRGLQALERILFMACWTASVWVTFEPRFLTVPPHPYMLLAMLAWPALRLGSRTVSLALVTLAVVSIVSRTVTVGPSIWGGNTPTIRLLNVQLFVGFTSIIGYFLTASYQEIRTLFGALSESEERFRLITSNSPDHIIVQDRDLRYSFVLHPQAGLTEKDMIGKTDHEFLSKDDADRLVVIKKRVIETGTPVHVELPIATKTGATEYFDGSYIPQRSLDGSVIGLFGYFRNVTESKRMERALRESESNYRTLVEDGSEAIFITDDNGRYIGANAKACTIVGYTLAELQMMTISDLASPKEKAAPPLALSDMRSGHNVLVERRLRRKDGSLFYAEISGKRLSDGRYQGIVRDISLRRQMEETLRRSEEQYRNLFNNAEVGMIRSRVDGSEVIACNDRFVELVGGLRQEIEGRPSVLAWANPSARAVMMERLRANGCVRDFECEVRAKDGMVKVCLASARVLPDKGIMEGSIIDITSWKRAEQERMDLEHQLAQTQKLESLGLLAGGIAHDFNNLMAAIYGNVETALDGDLDPETTASLSRAVASIGRARDLTRQLLTFAKGGAPIKAIGSLFPLVEESTRFALSGSQVTCNFEVTPDLWRCNFDRNQIGQVIDNIVINAKQAMPSGGAIQVVASNVRLRDEDRSALPAGDYVLISIEDTGMGIPAEALPRIFDPFFTTKEQGRGLGLSTCHSIMRRHDGSVTAESTLGKGTTFRLLLPAARTSDHESTPLPLAAIQRGHGMVLVMDDEPVVRKVLATMLTSLGYSVECVEHGEAVVETFSREKRDGHSFRAVILDLTVRGGMGGKDAARALRALDQEVPLFVTSGYAEDPVMANPKLHGFTASLCKPFVRAELSAFIEYHCKNRAAS